MNEVIEVDELKFMFDQNNGVLFKKSASSFYHLTYNETYKRIENKFMFYLKIEFITIYLYYDKIIYHYKIYDQEFKHEKDKIFEEIKKETHITGFESKFISMFLDKLREKAFEENTIQILYDPVYIDDAGLIQTFFSPSYLEIDLKQTLEELNKAYKIVTNQKAFVITFCYSLLSLLSYYFRKNMKEFPFLIASGRSRAGKTSLMGLFTLTGLDQPENEGKAISNTVKSIFMLSYTLSEGFLPLIIDDISAKFFEDYSEDLKGAAGSTVLAKRGQRNLSAKIYSFTRNPMFTCNQQVSLELANSFRTIIMNFDESNKQKQNIEQWFQLQFQPGFLFKIFYELFNNTPLNLIFEYLQSIKESEESNQRFITFAYTKIKNLYEQMHIEFLFEKPELEKNEDNDVEDLFLSELLDQWIYIKDAEESMNATKQTTEKDSAGNPHLVTLTIKSKYFHRPYLSKFNLDIVSNWINKEHIIYLSRNGFKTWLDKNKQSYWRTIKDYKNNSRLNPKPVIGNHRFEGQPRQCLKIILTKQNAPFLDEDKLI